MYLVGLVNLDDSIHLMNTSSCIGCCDFIRPPYVKSISLITFQPSPSDISVITLDQEVTLISTHPWKTFCSYARHETDRTYMGRPWALLEPDIPVLTYGCLSSPQKRTRWTFVQACFLIVGGYFDYSHCPLTIILSRRDI
jgi:hypothetical protein